MSRNRTPPSKAFEVLAMHLNFNAGTTVPVNEVAKATGLAWATVNKYARIIAMVKKLAPEVDVTDEGIEVSRSSEAAEAALEDPVDGAVLYTFTHARKAGKANSWVDLANHEKLPASVDFDQATMFGFVEFQGYHVRLTPEGLMHANHLYRGLVERVPEVMSITPEPSSGEVFLDDRPEESRVMLIGCVSWHGFGGKHPSVWQRMRGHAVVDPPVQYYGVKQ